MVSEDGSNQFAEAVGRAVGPEAFVNLELTETCWALEKAIAQMKLLLEACQEQGIDAKYVEGSPRFKEISSQVADLQRLLKNMGATVVVPMEVFPKESGLLE